MAYTHSKYEVEMQPMLPTTFPAANEFGVRMTVTTAAAKWGPGFVPHYIKGAAVIPLVTTALTNDASVVFEADISTPGTPTRIFNINWPTAIRAHTSIYHVPTYNIEIKPGMMVQCRVTTAADAAASAKVVLYVEPRWEEAGNLTGMVITT